MIPSTNLLPVLLLFISIIIRVTTSSSSSSLFGGLRLPFGGARIVPSSSFSEEEEESEVMMMMTASTTETASTASTASTAKTRTAQTEKESTAKNVSSSSSASNEDHRKEDDLHSFPDSEDASVTLAPEDLDFFINFISRYLESFLFDLAISFSFYAFTPYFQFKKEDPPAVKKSINEMNECTDECLYKLNNALDSIDTTIQALFGPNESMIWKMVTGPYVADDDDDDDDDNNNNIDNNNRDSKRPIVTPSLKKNLQEVAMHSKVIDQMVNDYSSTKMDIYSEEHRILKKQWLAIIGPNDEEIIELEKKNLQLSVLEITENISLLIRATGVFPSYHWQTVALVVREGIELLQEEIDHHKKILAAPPSSFLYPHNLGSDELRRNRVGHKMQLLINQLHQMIILCTCAYRPYIQPETGVEDEVRETQWEDRVVLLEEITSFMPEISAIIKQYGHIYESQKKAAASMSSNTRKKVFSYFSRTFG